MKTIVSAGIFVVCARVFVQCRPKAAYEKYIRLLINLMVLLLLIEPFLTRIDSFFGKIGLQLQKGEGRTEWAGGPALNTENWNVERIAPIGIEPIIVEVEE